MSNEKFQNALRGVAQKVPPIWFMRQAGRYHKHYQALRAKYDFMRLCKDPELAAQVALGPVQDFDFDVAILFSDLLFPLEALGMGLKYDPGPILDRELKLDDLKKLRPLVEAKADLSFQYEAVRLTRARLPREKSLIGFIGGPWTLFSYAVSGGHDGSLVQAKSDFHFFQKFSDILIPLLFANIQLQLDGGAEVVMIFDTAAGELSPLVFNQEVAPGLNQLAEKFKGRLGYYSKGTQSAHLMKNILPNANWAGLGVDHRWDLAQVLPQRSFGFTQGNFDQALLFSEPDTFRRHLLNWLAPLRDLDPNDRRGWVCGLGHGVLPKTPEENVRHFVQIVRDELAK